MGQGLLKLSFDGDWSVKQLSDFLGTFRRAYGSILHFERSFESRDEFRHPRHWREFPPFVVIDPLIRQGDRLEKPDAWTATLALTGEPQLKTIQIASPGFLESIGNLNPLTVIADFIKWCANRRLDRRKQENEVERGSLENELLKNKILKERIDILTEAGIPKRQVRELLANHVAKPLLDLAPIVESKKVTADLKALPEGRTTESKKKRAEPHEPDEDLEVETPGGDPEEP